jgi:hypothetical protein
VTTDGRPIKVTTTCSNCGGIDDPEATARELRYARTVCECYECGVCLARGDVNSFICDHSPFSYRKVLPRG